MNTKASGNFSAAKSEQIALRSRHRILQITHRAQTSHIGSALSVVDILSVLYSGIANVSPETANDPRRDFIVFSKGHAAASMYSILAECGFIDAKELNTYCENGSPFGGHVTHHGKIGVELSTVSLGHGLPYGMGIALSNQLNNFGSKTYVIISDGECDEGTTWESALMANQFQLRDLVVIIDRNRIQSLADTETTMALEPLAEKWISFNWKVSVVDGHSHSELAEAFAKKEGPHCIIANTVKGKGVSFMEDKVLWHYRPPSETDLVNATLELGRRNQ